MLREGHRTAPLLCPAWRGRTRYLVATEAVARVHDEGLPSSVVLTHVQALTKAEVLDLQEDKQRGQASMVSGVLRRMNSPQGDECSRSKQGTESRMLGAQDGQPPGAGG